MLLALQFRKKTNPKHNRAARGCKLPADTRPRHEMLHFHYVRVLGTHGDHPSTSKAQKDFF